MQQTIDMRAFWRAVGQRALGSTVVTARGPEGPAGFLGLSSSHVCAEPPTMLVSIDKRTAALAAVREAGHFALNYLARDAAGLAESFGGKGALRGAERFTTMTWRTLVTGAPVLEDAVGAIDCTVEEMIERHGVFIVLGRVVATLDGPRGDPLVHFRGGYL